jgi:hypothetical protein
VAVFANYTSLRTQGNYGAATAATLPLDNFIPRTCNAGVSYARSKFTGSVKYNYKSQYPTSASAGTYNYRRGTCDVAVAWALRRQATFFAEVKNLTNEARDSYRVLPTRLVGYATDGAIFNFGVKGQF